MPLIAFPCHILQCCISVCLFVAVISQSRPLNLTDKEEKKKLREGGEDNKGAQQKNCNSLKGIECFIVIL